MQPTSTVYGVIVVVSEYPSCLVSSVSRYSIKYIEKKIMSHTLTAFGGIAGPFTLEGPFPVIEAKVSFPD